MVTVPTLLSNGLYFEGTIYTYQVETQNGTPVTAPMIVNENLNNLTGYTLNNGTVTGESTINGTFTDNVGWWSTTPNGFPATVASVTNQSFTVDMQTQNCSVPLTTTVVQTVSDTQNPITGASYITGSSTIVTQ
jgi:hypothetical protein